ncbi:glycosyltransferase family 4 protein [Helicobacter pylori]
MTSTSLLFITQWFSPEPVTVPTWICTALARRDWEVEVLTAHPNYPSGVVQTGHHAGRYVSETRDGVRVHRAPVYPSHDRSAVRRFANYASWALSASLVAPWRSRRRGVTLVYSSPATAALPAMLARVLVGRRYVLQVQDIWPDSVTATGLVTSRGLMRVLEHGLTWFVALSYRLAHAVVVISPGAADLLVKRGVPTHKVHLVHNWADERALHPAPQHDRLRRQLGVEDGEVIFMYAGAMGPAQSLETAVEAIGRAKGRHHLVLLGDGVSRAALQARAATVAPARIHFCDPVPLGEVSDTMAGADAQLVVLADEPLFAVTMPSKVQGVLATGSLCVASAPGDAARVVTEAGGLSARPGDVDDLARAMDQVAALSEDERAARRAQAEDYYRTHLSEQTGADRLSQILDQTLKNQNG